jgi:hypothetical protein
MQKAQNNQYDGDNDQRMDPTAGLREAWADATTEKAEQPQDYQNYDDCPYHKISPFELDATWLKDRVAFD